MYNPKGNYKLEQFMLKEKEVITESEVEENPIDEEEELQQSIDASKAAWFGALGIKG